MTHSALQPLSIWIAIAAFALQACGAGTIEYMEDENVLWVRGYPERAPATPADLVTFDRERGLGKVEHDEAADTTRLGAALWIGDNQDAGTFFQVGSVEHPQQVLVVLGTVWVRPPRASVKRSDGRSAIVNQLTVGMPENPGVQARLTLLTDGSKRVPGVLQLGEYDAEVKSAIYGGDLHVFNSAVEVRDAATAQPATAREFSRWYMTNLQLVDSRIAGLVTTIHAHFQHTVYRVQGTRFENGRVTLYGLRVSDCEFHNLRQVIRDRAQLIRCALTDNEENFWFDSSAGEDVILIDCSVGASRKPLRIARNDIDPRKAAQTRRRIVPTVQDRRTLQVRVIDSQGTPVPQAWVRVEPRETRGMVVNEVLLTDDHGLTTQDIDKCFQLVYRKWSAANDPFKPKLETFTFVVSAWKPGFKKAERVLRPAEEAAAQPLVLSLQPR